MAYCRHVHVKTCTGCNFNTPASTASKVCQKKDMCLCTSYYKMNDWNLQQRINVKFHVLFGMSACETCAMNSDAHGTEAMKKSSILKWNK